MSLLSLDHAVQRYERRGEPQPADALRVPAFALERGELVAVLGSNGSGKSTLLETLAFLRRPALGRTLMEGRDPWADGTALDARRRCPILLQHTLLFSGSVLDNVAWGLKLRGVGAGEAKRRALTALAELGLEGFEKRRHGELSGGEVRRVGLARVLALDSEVLVLDEPFSGLDAEGSERLERLLGKLLGRGTAVLLATHGARRVLPLATRIVHLVQGRFFDDNLDNQSEGTLRPGPQGWTWLDRSGWSLALREEELARDPWLGLGPAEGPARLMVSSRRVFLRQPGNDGLCGDVDAVRREGARVRVRVRLPCGQLVRASIPLAASPGVQLGQHVELGFEPRSLHLLPGRR